MKITFILLTIILTMNLGYAGYHDLKKPESVPFIEHIVKDDPTSYDNALAVNVPYASIIKLRKIIETKTRYKLDFFKGWNPKGEAHVTTISPPEFVNALRHGITMERINEIAIAEQIQKADIKLLGIGSGKKIIEGKMQETFFVIVDSYKLREIRFKIYQEFVANKGEPSSFDPSWFFPHVTIGYTLKDLHEPDVLKDIKHSLDPRFNKFNKKFLDLN